MRQGGSSVAFDELSFHPFTRRQAGNCLPKPTRILRAAQQEFGFVHPTSSTFARRGGHRRSHPVGGWPSVARCLAHGGGLLATGARVALRSTKRQRDVTPSLSATAARHRERPRPPGERRMGEPAPLAAPAVVRLPVFQEPAHLPVEGGRHDDRRHGARQAPPRAPVPRAQFGDEPHPAQAQQQTDVVTAASEGGPFVHRPPSAPSSASAASMASSPSATPAA